MFILLVQIPIVQIPIVQIKMFIKLDEKKELNGIRIRKNNKHNSGFIKFINGRDSTTYIIDNLIIC